MINFNPSFCGSNAAARQKTNTQQPVVDKSAVKAEIKSLEEYLQRQLETPPNNKDSVDWAYFKSNIERIQEQLSKLRKICPVDRTNLEEVLMAKPTEYFRPKKADNIKDKGIKLVQNIPTNQEELDKITFTVVPIFTNANTNEEMIRIGKRDGINIETVRDENGEYKIGVKDIWHKGNYFSIDRAGAVMKYGKYSADDEYVDQEWAQKNKDENNKILDSAVVAYDEGVEILPKSYVHKGGKHITKSDMIRWDGFPVHKDPNAEVNVVGYDVEKEYETLEGKIRTNITMGDVEGYPYNTWKEIKKQIAPDKKGFSKLTFAPNDEASKKFVELIKAGTEESENEALKFLKEETAKSEQA